MPGRFIVLSLCLLLAAAGSYLIGNARAPLLDRDEPRYAITSRNMLQSGDYVVPRQYDRPRTAKPPMIYWLQASSMRVLGTTSAAAARLPSSLAMLAVVGGLLLVLRRETDEETALTATAVFAFAGLTGFVAKMAITDAVLLASVGAAMLCLYRYWRGDRSWTVFVVWGLATGVSGLTKGPVGVGIMVATVAGLAVLSLLDRKFPPKASWRTFDFPGRSPGGGTRKLTLKWVSAVGLVLAVVLPWVVMVTLREPEFLSRALDHDIVKRSTRGVDGQARPPGFYLLTLFGTFFPWSMLIPAAVVLGWKNRHRPLTRFCLAWLLGGWVMFEAVTSKMVHWFLPMFVPLSVLTGEAVVGCVRGRFDDLRSRGFRVAAGVWAVITVGLGVAAWTVVWRLPPTPAWVAGVMTVWAVGTAAAGWVLWWQGRLYWAVGVLSGCMAALFPVVFAVVVPNLWFAGLGRAVGEDLLSRGAVRRGDVIMVGFREPSLAFYQGGTIREAESGDLDTTEATWATVSGAVWAGLGEATRRRWRMVSTHRGIAYADGPETIEVYVLRRAGVD